MGQDLQKHHWKERVILLLAAQNGLESINSQFELLMKEKVGLIDRKLVIYLVTPESTEYASEALQYQPTEVESGQNLYNTFKSDRSTFVFILIGLDGGVKMREYSLVTTAQLFAIIDGMPMRKAEKNN